MERGLPQSFLGPWHAWMDASLAATRASQGRLSKWLETPIWNFILAGGVCGPDAALGLWLPSVDAVSRHYPLTVAAVFEGQTQSSWDESGLAWLRQVEAFASEAVLRLRR